MKRILKIISLALSMIMIVTVLQIAVATQGFDIGTDDSQSAPAITAEKMLGVSQVQSKSSTVYYAEHSKKYHCTKKCRTLARSRNIYKTTVKKAKAMGLKKCKVCY